MPNYFYLQNEFHTNIPHLTIYEIRQLRMSLQSFINAVVYGYAE